MIAYLVQSDRAQLTDRDFPREFAVLGPGAGAVALGGGRHLMHREPSTPDGIGRALALCEGKSETGRTATYGDVTVGYEPTGHRHDEFLRNDAPRCICEVECLEGTGLFVPVVHRVNGGPSLPRRICVGADGRVGRVAEPRFKDLADRGEAAFRMFAVLRGYGALAGIDEDVLSDGSVEGAHRYDEIVRGLMVPEERLIMLLYDGIMVAHRYGMQELSLMQLFDEDAIFELIWEMVDGPAMAEAAAAFQKKK
jgi:hypothetical protein